MTAKLPQLHLIEVATDDVVRFCRQKYGIVPNSKVIERIVIGINFGIKNLDNLKNN